MKFQKNALIKKANVIFFILLVPKTNFARKDDAASATTMEFIGLTLDDVK